ncbi:hypothetical protein BDV26DRAFT_253313 [Aspergillus bertholletiae]|uniref:Uncharacterized protein n=1 Tax=Aspergillus bertholletiae TaxID=1226010 RepID=A0A5N7BM94_9EURO|nr:hypothetical protein BDV26DRAFT_253313 [Aspergillus bertholletiae]
MKLAYDIFFICWPTILPLFFHVGVAEETIMSSFPCKVFLQGRVCGLIITTTSSILHNLRDTSTESAKLP